MVGYYYTRTEVVCNDCTDWTHYFAECGERLLCDECTDGRPLSDFGKAVMREVALDE